MARSCKWVLAILVVQLYNFKTLQHQLTQQICQLGNEVGRCVDHSLCPHFNSSIAKCSKGKVCCIVSSKIVTPTDAFPAAPPAGSPSSAPSLPSGAPSPAAGAPSPSAGAPPAGVAPPSGSPSVGDPPAGASPPSGSPSAAPPLSPGGSPPAGAGAPNTGRPLGPPPSGGPPGGGPPPLMGNIVVDPNMRPSDLEAIVVSAEDVSSIAAQFDQRCEMYNSMIQPKIASPLSRGTTPVVMIFSGTDSLETEFPHMAALGYGSDNSIQWLCGGSLITPNFVLTAAHCLTAPPLGEVRLVKLGNTVLNQNTPNTQTANVINKIYHPQYDRPTQYNDIALLQLDRSVNINPYVVPICLFSSTNYEDRNLIATGWGRTETSTSSRILQKVALEIFSQSECQAAYSAVSQQQLPLGIQESIQVCAGSRSGSEDTCQGDSGGPLQIRKNNRWYQVGITSVGLQCGTPNVPGVYTRLASYLQWIHENVFEK